MELFVILSGVNAPDAADWNRSLAAASVPATLTEQVDLSHHTGFLPVTVNGKATGFYFLLESYSELAAHYPAIGRLKLKEPVVYSLGYGGHAAECAAVFYSASVLVSKFGGTAFEPQGGVIMGAKDLLDAAKLCDGMPDTHE